VSDKRECGMVISDWPTAVRRAREVALQDAIDAIRAACKVCDGEGTHSDMDGPCGFCGPAIAAVKALMGPK
jgi:hypothetical protein